MNTDTTFEEAHHYKPRSKAVPEPQNRKHTLPSPEQQVKAKKLDRVKKERREAQENDERSSLVIYIDPNWGIYCRAGFILIFAVNIHD